MTAGRTGHRQTDTGRRHRDAFKSEQRASRTSGFDCPISHGIEAKEHCCKPITCFFPLTCHITHTLTHKHTHVCEWQNENLRLWVHPCWVTWCKTTGRTISALILPVSQTLSLHAPFSLSLSANDRPFLWRLGRWGEWNCQDLFTSLPLRAGAIRDVSVGLFIWTPHILSCPAENKHERSCENYIYVSIMEHLAVLEHAKNSLQPQVVLFYYVISWTCYVVQDGWLGCVWFLLYVQ